MWVRIRTYGQPVVADEMSTLYLVRTNGFQGVIEFVRGDAEISPPLYFLLAWLATKLGSAPELIRLPSIVFALATLPVYFLLGQKLFNRQAAILATTIAALSPMLVYLAGYGRSYSVMFFFLALSTLAMLYATGSGRTRWWVVYAVSSAAVMYTHYTGAFVLVAQLVWLLAYSKEDRVKALLANAGAVLLYIPWIPGYLADSDSPTTKILEALQGYGFEAKRTAVEQMLFWKASAEPWTVNRLDVFLVTGAAVVAVIAAISILHRRRALGAWLKNPGQNVVLVTLLILATPVGALLLNVVSTDVFGTRNLAASWIGIPLALGALLVAAGRVWGSIATVLVVLGMGLGSVAVADPDRSAVRFDDAAEYIESAAKPGDAVVNRAHLTPVPLTPLDAYLDLGPGIGEYQLGLPVSEPPFLPTSVDLPDPQAELDKALSGRDRIYFVTFGTQAPPEPGVPFEVAGKQAVIPRDWKVVSHWTEEGIFPITVTVLERK